MSSGSTYQLPPPECWKQLPFGHSELEYPTGSEHERTCAGGLGGGAGLGGVGGKGGGEAAPGTNGGGEGAQLATVPCGA
jgi:hypothetical protein